MKKAKIHDEIYRNNFIIIWDCTEKQSIDFVEKLFDATIDLSNEGISPARACWFIDLPGDILWLSDDAVKNDEFFDIDHEIVHRVLNTLREAGMIPDANNEEAFAYYYQYIKRKIYKALTGIPGKEKKRTNPGK